MKRKPELKEEEKWNKYDFEKTLAKFTIDEPFYSYISSNIDKIPTDSLDTAGVMIEDGRPVLYYNEEFFNSLNWKTRQGLLIHEFLHLIFNHVSSRKPNKGAKYDRAWGFATDFAINSLIDEDRLPDGGLIPGKWNPLSPTQKKLYSEEQIEAYEAFRNLVISWEKGESAEWYYNQIILNKDIFDKLDHSDGIISLLDDHGNWGKSSSEDGEIIENNLKNIIKEAVDFCNKVKNWGTISRELKEDIENIAKSKINWVSLLRYFVGRSRSVSFSSTIKKVSRRYPYIHAGRKRKRETKIVVCVDQSASVDNETLGKFFAELNGLSDYVEFVVVPFDTKVYKDKIFSWEKGKSYQRVLRGGTDFNIPTRWVNDNHSKFDAALFMTDGFCYKPMVCKIPRAWIICPDGELQFETSELVIQMN